MNQTNKTNNFKIVSLINCGINFLVEESHWNCAWALTSVKNNEKPQFQEEEIQVIVEDPISNLKVESRIPRIYISFKKLSIKISSSLVALIVILSPGVKNFANAKGKDFTKTSDAQYSEQIQVINVDNSNSPNDTSKSFCVRKPTKVREQEFDVKNNERIRKRRRESELFNQLVYDLEQKDSKENKEMGIVLRNSSVVSPLDKKKSEQMIIWEEGQILKTQNIKNPKGSGKFIFNPQKFPKFNIHQTKQNRKQLRKKLAKVEIFKRNLIQFQNRQPKDHTLNKLILLIVPILNTLYPIFCVNNKDKKQKKIIHVVKKLKINNKNYVGIAEFLQLLEKRRHIDKLVENYETIMLFSIFMTACQLKFNASGLLVNESEPFISVEARIEEWIMQNKMLVCFIIFSTVTILTMKILPHLENKNQEYFLYILKMLEILRKQEQFILQNMSEIFKDAVKDFLLYIAFTFMFNFMISILAVSPVTLNLKLNLNENDISLNLDFIDLNKKYNPTKDEIN